MRKVFALKMLCNFYQTLNCQEKDVGRGMGDAGAIVVARLIKTNSTVTKLDLSINSIGDLGASEIRKALQDNPSSPIKINFSGNNTVLFPIKIEIMDKTKFLSLLEESGKGVKIYEAYCSSTRSEELFRTEVRIKEPHKFFEYWNLRKQIEQYEEEDRNHQENLDNNEFYSGYYSDPTYWFKCISRLNNFLESLSPESKQNWNEFIGQMEQKNYEIRRYDSICKNFSYMIKKVFEFNKSKIHHYLESKEKNFFEECCHIIINGENPDDWHTLQEHVISIKKYKEYLEEQVE